jgi:hypothetical protein
MSSQKYSHRPSSLAVNGQSCSYGRLGKYQNCARAEPGISGNKVTAVPRPVAPAVVAPVAPAVVAPVAPAPVAAPAKEGYYYLDPSPTSLPGGANTGATNYTPSYVVPNYPPIDTTAFNSNVMNCGGYKKILVAYTGMNGSSCTTNYINN